MDIKKSAGWNRIRVRDLKSVQLSISIVISRLINLSLKEGLFPDCLKTAVIRPIHKSGSKKEFSNFRPIAILSTLDKVFEKYVSCYLNNYLTENNILSENQFGFRKKRSTEMVLEEFSNTANTAMNSKSHCLALFIDFAKAFDTVDHVILVQALSNIGITGSYLKWFESYLKNRKLTVKVLNQFSYFKDIKYGVPQGSQLGPVLFNIYLNRMLENMQHCKIWAFADDVLILAQHKELLEAEYRLQQDFITFTKYSHDRGLIINPKKTCLMHIHPKNLKFIRNPVIRLHNCECVASNNTGNNCSCTQIKLVEETKYLGVILDKRMTWTIHILALHEKSNP